MSGPSAAGKTTWCRERFPGHLVEEYAPTGSEPAGAAPEFWCAVGCGRWREAVELEAATGLAVCDDDPMKLHYTWSLARLGLVEPAVWQREITVHREAVAARRLGFADLMLVAIAPIEELWRRRAADSTRRRRNFDLHVRLAEPLREWYEAVERAEPSRVRWELPVAIPAAVADRYDLGFFDAVLAGLPALD